MIVRRVWRNKANGQLLVTVPKDSEIEEGDYVKLTKVENDEEG